MDVLSNTRAWKIKIECTCLLLLNYLVRHVGLELQNMIVRGMVLSISSTVLKCCFFGGGYCVCGWYLTRA